MVGWKGDGLEAFRTRGCEAAWVVEHACLFPRGEGGEGEDGGDEEAGGGGGEDCGDGEGVGGEGDEEGGYGDLFL